MYSAMRWGGVRASCRARVRAGTSVRVKVKVRVRVKVKVGVPDMHVRVQHAYPVLGSCPACIPCADFVSSMCVLRAGLACVCRDALRRRTYPNPNILTPTLTLTLTLI